MEKIREELYSLIDEYGIQAYDKLIGKDEELHEKIIISIKKEK